MLLTLTNHRAPATDLGYLLHKHPANVHKVDLSFGHAAVFYPEASEAQCTAAMLITVNPVELVRGRAGAAGGERTLEDYVNDRAYTASSFTSVAMGRVFGTALAGRCEKRPDLVTARLPLRIEIPVLRAPGGEDLLERLFAPLGYRVQAARLPLDERFPEWGASRYFHLVLEGEVTVHDALSHLYVLLPALDEDKHYYVGKDEVSKLLRHGEGWLAAHPERGAIVQRYLMRRIELTKAAFEQLVEDEPETEERKETAERREQELERPMTLHTQRLICVAAELRKAGAKRVVDLGCGEGRLLRLLMADRSVEEVLGMDVSHRSLEKAARRLKLDRMAPHRRSRIKLIQGSLLYRDRRVEGFDCAAVVEVIEHLDRPRLAAFERVVFEFARPGTVVITTPNREYNVNFPTLPAGQFRHSDHRFEWTRAEFAAWSERVAATYKYAVRIEPVGPVDEATGAPSQMAVFQR